MSTHVSMLRGINVTGHRKIRMAELRRLYEDLGFLEVESYLQSGNVVFDSGRRGSATIANAIERGIVSRFGHDVAVILRTPEELGKIVETNPFLSRRGIAEDALHVTFLCEAPGGSSALASVDRRSGNDEFIVAGREIYLACPGGYGRTRFSNGFFEGKLKARTTTRNWRTVTALHRMAADR